jgi:hypothetical protein
MQIQDILQISVLGIALSAVMEYIKAKLGTTSLTSKLTVVGLSVVIGAVYYFFRDTNIFATILAILGISSTIYALLLK